MTRAKFDANKVRPVVQPSAALLALRGDLASPPPPAREPVTLDYGTKQIAVEVVALSGRDRLKLLDASLEAARAEAERTGRDPSEITHVRLSEHTPALIAAATVLPGTDERVFTGPEDELLAIMPPAEMAKLSELAARLNRESKAEREAAKNDSGAVGAESTAS